MPSRISARCGRGGAAAKAPRPDAARTGFATSTAVRARMQAHPRRDTSPELALRRLLHARGLRYRVDAPLPLPGVRRRADLVFPSARMAVFVDGSFWHACPEHGTAPRANAWYWGPKLARNAGRDRDTDRRLAEAGWLAVRVWEHEDPAEAALRVEAAVRARRAAGRDRPAGDAAGPRAGSESPPPSGARPAPGTRAGRPRSNSDA